MEHNFEEVVLGGTGEYDEQPVDLFSAEAFAPAPLSPATILNGLAEMNDMPLPPVGARDSDIGHFETTMSSNRGIIPHEHIFHNDNDIARHNPIVPAIEPKEEAEEEIDVQTVDEKEGEEEGGAEEGARVGNPVQFANVAPFAFQPQQVPQSQFYGHPHAPFAINYPNNMWNASYDFWLHLFSLSYSAATELLEAGLIVPDLNINPIAFGQLVASYNVQLKQINGGVDPLCEECYARGQRNGFANGFADGFANGFRMTNEINNRQNRQNVAGEEAPAAKRQKSDDEDASCSSSSLRNEASSIE